MLNDQQTDELLIAPYLNMIIRGYARYHCTRGEISLEVNDGGIVTVSVDDVPTSHMSVEQALLYGIRYAVSQAPELSFARRVLLYTTGGAKERVSARLEDAGTGRTMFVVDSPSALEAMAHATQEALLQGWIVTHFMDLTDKFDPEFHG